VAVTTRDGRTVERSIDSFLGHPDQPISPDQVVDVLLPFLRQAMSERDADRVVELVMGLDDAFDVVELMGIVRDFPTRRSQP
jgi:hypothetical protein